MIIEKCDVKGLAMGLGLAWGLYMICLGWVAITGWGSVLVDNMSSLYIGFKPGFVGGIIGGIWGFIDGAIGGVLIAYFYNMFANRS
ncbi:MAG: membrane-associated protein [Candidatus Portnoybacteria bacterium CG10_big_fil_rev_8_21_14_0_10_36_7]|uniref:Membrane-associated protein n=1 Tax=Candidatus Portnoybacteria bacterium CG10_big_fil_rev_8_21_14_0_10_36_7 TaxID=1974812 RepID=A0A2M8KEV8_9BACT|nr:MAG: membrane-associated protein [Candidatus Portnoybacteria bacterium CG10_big_fil_rev_8_21_14_0_10_36_7]